LPCRFASSKAASARANTRPSGSSASSSATLIEFKLTTLAGFGRLSPIAASIPHKGATIGILLNALRGGAARRQRRRPPRHEAAA